MLKVTLKRTYKKDKGLYDAAMKKIEAIIENPHRYKSLRYDLNGLRKIFNKNKK
jgi:tyrosine-protein phosphatase YwqE